MVAQPADPEVLRAQIRRLCQRASDYCLSFGRHGIQGFDVAGCINEQKAEIKRQFARYQGVVDVDELVENYEWEIPAQGGKRKRKTMHRKRVNNRSRRNRRVHK